MRRASAASDVGRAASPSDVWRAAAAHMRGASAATAHMRRSAASAVRRTTAASGRRRGLGGCSTGRQSGRHQDQGCADGGRDLEHGFFPARCVMKSSQNQSCVTTPSAHLQ